MAEELVARVVDVRAGRGGMDQVMRLFRQVPLWVETEQSEHSDERYAVRAFRHEGLWWLPVCTSLEYLARFAQEAGRGGAEIQYGQLSGAEVIDEALPVLPRGTGMILDPTADHVFALPPVTGIVPEALAVGGGRQ